MGSTRKTTQKPSVRKRTLVRQQREKQQQDEAVAEAVLRPTWQAAATITEYGKSFGDLDFVGMIAALTKQTDVVVGNDLKRGENMLTAQAHTLDAIFNTLARRAINSEKIDVRDCYLKLALRAQSQCRSTWQAVTTMKNPPVVGYVRQANIAHGPQQVNNATEPGVGQSDKHEKPELENELLEKTDGERMVCRAPGTTGRIDKNLATVGNVDRPDDT